MFAGPAENLREVLVNLVRKTGTSKAKRLGYYNALVRLCHRFGTAHVDAPCTREEVLAWSVAFCISVYFHNGPAIGALLLLSLLCGIINSVVVL